MVKIDKPWGYEQILIEKPYVLKRMCLNAGCRTSLQYHPKKKIETMIVESGSGFIYHNEIKTFVKPGSIVHIPRGITHRVEALNGQNLVILEVSSPPNSDSDIVRIEDDYGR